MCESAVILDLEGTVIESWGRRVWLDKNIRAIGRLVAASEQRGSLMLGLMSWAVMDESDLDEFRFALQKPLENRLGARFAPGLTRSMNGWARLIGQSTRTSPGPTPAMVYQLFDKPSMLFWLRGLPTTQLPSEIILVDDDIPHGDTIISPERTIQLINVHNLTS
jgi:hypothetical protein